MNVIEKLKKWVDLQLEKLAKENRKAFGDKAPDCCEFGRKSADPGKTRQGNRLNQRAK
jgi:hypothetical protein